ncbi:hypothetical protein [Geomicrobium sp. JCM 19039]|uniref:hypothetical protein n=1 Tax=Geomicrobium sp. JCM 19039 TaxID=1460636 RepID=UPI00045F3CC8|nr:hypothetical protein [Geomicrobium sp. JCM 19039]GAK11377.1 hypothetical protein JCM19039_1069 [Geomicrobium sp. JCM 19039]
MSEWIEKLKQGKVDMDDSGNVTLSNQDYWQLVEALERLAKTWLACENDEITLSEYFNQSQDILNELEETT